MWFWVAGGIVIGAVVLLVWVAGALRRDLAELQRVADLARERAGFAQRRAQPTAEQVQRAVAELQRALASTQEHATGTQRRLAARRRPPGG